MSVGGKSVGGRLHKRNCVGVPWRGHAKRRILASTQSLRRRSPRRRIRPRRCLRGFVDRGGRLCWPVQQEHSRIMKPLFPSMFLVLSLASAAASAGARAQSDPALSHAKALLDKVILIDGHNDLPWAIREDQQAAGRVELYDL